MSGTLGHAIRGKRSQASHPRHHTSDPAELRGARGADLRLMRELNRLLVLNTLRTHGPLSRVAIARRTGLSRTTVSSIMEGLLEDELVREGGTQSASPQGGRRAILVHFNTEAGWALGVDMGRTHVTTLLCDLAATVRARRSSPFDADRGPDTCLPEIVAELRALVAAAELPWDRVVGVGLGMPGPMDADLHRTIRPPRMPGWDDVDVGGGLSRVLGVPVYVDNDANFGALGESRYGAGLGVADMAYVKIGAGIGGALVMGGQIYRGSRGSAGEIGHVTIDANGPACECGNRGCLEVYAGAPAIVADARERVGGMRTGAARTAGTRPSATRTALPRPTGMVDLKGAATSALDVDALDMDIADVVGAALAGDAACRAALAAAGERIGIVLAGLVNLVNPSLILLGGGVAKAGAILLDPIQRTVSARSFSVARRDLRIAVGSLGDNAIALGGIAMVLDTAFTGGRPGAYAADPGDAVLRQASAGDTLDAMSGQRQATVAVAPRSVVAPTGVAPPASAP